MPKPPSPKVSLMRTAFMIAAILSVMRPCWAQEHRLYGYAEIPLLDHDGNEITDPSSGERLFTHVCFVTLPSASNDVVEVPVRGYRSAIVYYAVRQDPTNRQAEVIQVDQLKYYVTRSKLIRLPGTYQFVNLRVAMQLLDEPPANSRCSREEWAAAGRVRIEYRTKELQSFVPAYGLSPPARHR
jgi:hypothetical protein